MSVISVENSFKNDLQDLIVSDFIIDSEDVNKVFQNTNINLYSIKNPKIKINIIKFEEDPNHRVSSFIISKNDFIDNGNLEWQLLEKIDIDNCLVLLLSKDHAKDESLDDWLEECGVMKEIYNVTEDGKICVTSGFGPGIYSLFGIKDVNKEMMAIKMTFIKESI
jgi:hypothetical protein